MDRVAHSCVVIMFIGIFLGHTIYEEANTKDIMDDIVSAHCILTYII